MITKKQFISNMNGKDVVRVREGEGTEKMPKITYGIIHFRSNDYYFEYDIGNGVQKSYGPKLSDITIVSDSEFYMTMFNDEKLSYFIR